MRLVSQNITVSAMAMGSVCEMVDQVLKALQGENDQKKIEEGFRAWAGSLTKTRVQSFQAHRLPHYLKLADALRVPAQS